jgi:hypothetical protein
VTLTARRWASSVKIASARCSASIAVPSPFCLIENACLLLM